MMTYLTLSLTNEQFNNEYSFGNYFVCSQLVSLCLGSRLSGREPVMKCDSRVPGQAKRFSLGKVFWGHYTRFGSTASIRQAQQTVAKAFLAIS